MAKILHVFYNQFGYWWNFIFLLHKNGQVHLVFQRADINKILSLKKGKYNINENFVTLSIAIRNIKRINQHIFIRQFLTLSTNHSKIGAECRITLIYVCLIVNLVFAFFQIKFFRVKIFWHRHHIFLKIEYCIKYYFKMCITWNRF